MKCKYCERSFTDPALPPDVYLVWNLAVDSADHFIGAVHYYACWGPFAAAYELFTLRFERYEAMSSQFIKIR